MVVVVMHQQNVHLQAAIDFVGDLCMQSIDRFNDIRSHLPSWGPQIDEDVAKYAEGLSNWMMGTLHWYAYRIVIHVASANIIVLL
jgi:hypothetical protein